MTTKIKDIPLNERPRERLINNGINSLSNEELLAILLKVGKRNQSAKDLALKILESIKDIRELKNYNYQQLSNISGIGKAKACTILSAIELGKRINSNQSIINDKMNNPQKVFNYYKNIIGDKKQEHFYCVYLDNDKRMISDKLLFIGTINYSIVHPREVFKEAYKVSASGIICIHNHPSGNILPSKNDYNITNKLIEVGNLLNIPIIDHIIISENNYYSFIENDDII